MSVLSRVYNFTSLAGTSIYGDNVDDEFNQIINLINGTSTNKRMYIVYSNGTQPPLKVNQTGAGALFIAQAGGVDALTIANNGQIVSTVSTGTAPIVVASTTKCTNLNADMVNGIEGSQLIRNDQASQAVLGNLRIKKASTGTYDAQVEMENDIFTFYRYNSSDNSRTALFDLSDINSSTRVFVAPANMRVQVAYEPTSDNDVVRKIDLQDRITNLIVPGMMTATADAFCMFVAPQACKIVGVKFGYLSGTPSGDATIVVNSFTNENVTMSQSCVAGTVYTDVLTTDYTLVAGQFIYLTWNGGSLSFTNAFAELYGYYIDE